MSKVLIVDTDSDFASKLGRKFIGLNHETRVVGDAKYGIVRAKSFEPELIVASTNVPGVPPAELVTQLNETGPAKIVSCGESETPEVIQQLVQAGTSDYVLKSAGVDAIVARCLGEAAESPTPAAEPEESEEENDEENSEEPSAEAADKPASNGGVTPLRAPVKEGKRPFVVVVAHSDDAKRETLRSTFEQASEALHVVAVSTSEDALKACSENRTVILSIDWEMPDKPAKAVIKELRALPGGKAVRVFITYKSHSPEKQRLAEFAGAMAFAGEPWDDGSLEAQVKHTIDVIRKRRRKAKIQALKAKAS